MGRSWVVVIAVLLESAVGCVRASVVECGDGRACPIGTTCDVVNATCIDPRGIDLPAGAIDFASLGCGESTALMVPLRNYGVSPIEFEAMSTVAGVTVSPSSATIEAGGSVVLTVTANPDPRSIPGVTVEGSLVLSTTYEQLERPIRMTTVGALVAADETLDFGELALGDSSTRSFKVTNSGNEATEMTVAIPTASGFSTIAPASLISLVPGQERVITVGFTPSLLMHYASTAALSFTGALCQPPPTGVELTGAASGDPILMSQTVVDFGVTDCEAEMAKLPVTLTSNLPMDQTLTSMLTGPDVVSYGQPPVVSLPTAGSATIDFARLAIPKAATPGMKTATVDVKASPDNVTKQVTLKHSVVAPVLGVTPATVEFAAPPYAIGTQTVMVTNTGNATGSIRVTPSQYMFGNGARIQVSPTTFLSNPGGSVTLTLTYISGGSGNTLQGARFTLDAPGQCGSPPAVSVSASTE